jgi:hypothetical protein
MNRIEDMPTTFLKKMKPELDKTIVQHLPRGYGEQQWKQKKTMTITTKIKRQLDRDIGKDKLLIWFRALQVHISCAYK